MSEQEKKAIRDEKLIAYLDAVDDREAHCGRVSKIIDTLRRIVSEYDKGTIFEGEVAEGLKLPTTDELTDALMECQESRRTEGRRYREALEAGVPENRMPPPSASKKGRPRINIAGPLA